MLSSNIKYIQNEGDFDHYVNSRKMPTIVKFTAEWCGPCQRIAPTFSALATRFHHKINFLEVDVDACEDIAERHNVKSMPTFVALNRGLELDRVSGANKDVLETLVTNIALGNYDNDD